MRPYFCAEHMMPAPRISHDDDEQQNPANAVNLSEKNQESDRKAPGRLSLFKGIRKEMPFICVMYQLSVSIIIYIVLLE